LGELGAETIALLKTPQRNLLLPIFVKTVNAQNLYEFVGNDAIDRDDPYGLVFMPPKNPCKKLPPWLCKTDCRLATAACVIGCNLVTDGFGAVICDLLCWEADNYCEDLCN
jgi:hypothetical protein